MRKPVVIQYIFAIKKDEDNPLWMEYISWLNNVYNCDWTGECNYYCFGKGYTCCFDDIRLFEEYISISLQEWNTTFKLCGKTILSNN